MKNYTITVNGKAYAVTVEEGAVSGIAAAPAAPAPAPPAAPAPAAAPAGAAGSVSVSAPMPGKVVAVKAAVGQAVTQMQLLIRIRNEAVLLRRQRVRELVFRRQAH